MTLASGYTYLRNDTDRLWFDEGLRRGWTLGEPAPRWARLWGLRHARALARFYADMYWDWRWEQLGLYSTGYSDWLRYAILRGFI